MHDQQQDKPMTMSEQINVLVALAQIGSHVVELFTRRPGTFGERYVGLQFVFSWVFCFVFSPLFYSRVDPRPMLWFWLAATGMLMVHRLAGIIRRWRGYETHSFFLGRSWFSGAPSTAAGIKEPLFVMVLGFVAAQYSEPLGVYLIVSAVCLWVSVTYCHMGEQARIRAAKDARLDAEWLMQETRKEE